MHDTLCKSYFLINTTNKIHYRVHQALLKLIFETQNNKMLLAFIRTNEIVS